MLFVMTKKIKLGFSTYAIQHCWWGSQCNHIFQLSSPPNSSLTKRKTAFSYCLSLNINFKRKTDPQKSKRSQIKNILDKNIEILFGKLLWNVCSFIVEVFVKKNFFECCGSNLEMEQGTVVFTNVAVVNLGSKKLNHSNANESQTRGFSFG